MIRTCLGVLRRPHTRGFSGAQLGLNSAGAGQSTRGVHALHTERPSENSDSGYEAELKLQDLLMRGKIRDAMQSYMLSKTYGMYPSAGTYRSMVSGSLAAGFSEFAIETIHDMYLIGYKPPFEVLKLITSKIEAKALASGVLKILRTKEIKDLAGAMTAVHPDFFNDTLNLLVHRSKITRDILGELLREMGRNKVDLHMSSMTTVAQFFALSHDRLALKKFVEELSRQSTVLPPQTIATALKGLAVSGFALETVQMLKLWDSNKERILQLMKLEAPDEDEAMILEEFKQATNLDQSRMEKLTLDLGTLHECIHSASRYHLEDLAMIFWGLLEKSYPINGTTAPIDVFIAVAYVKAAQGKIGETFKWLRKLEACGHKPDLRDIRQVVSILSLKNAGKQIEKPLISKVQSVLDLNLVMAVLVRSGHASRAIALYDEAVTLRQRVKPNVETMDIMLLTSLTAKGTRRAFTLCQLVVADMEIYDLLPQTETLRLLCLNLVKLGRVSQALNILEKASELRRPIGTWSVLYVGRAAFFQKETDVMQRVEDLMAKLRMPASEIYYSMSEGSRISGAVAKRAEKRTSERTEAQETKERPKKTRSGASQRPSRDRLGEP